MKSYAKEQGRYEGEGKENTKDDAAAGGSYDTVPDVRLERQGAGGGEAYRGAFWI